MGRGVMVSLVPVAKIISIYFGVCTVCLGMLFRLRCTESRVTYQRLLSKSRSVQKNKGGGAKGRKWVVQEKRRRRAGYIYLIHGGHK